MSSYKDMELTVLLEQEALITRTTQILSALADVTRFKILMALANHEHCVSDLERLCSVSQSAISHQLRLLKDRDLVKSRKEGQRCCYSLNDDHVKQILEQALEHASHVSAGIEFKD